MKRCFALLLALCLLLSISSPALADNVLRLPSSLKSIDEDAFRGDTSIDEVILPEGLETLGSGAFGESSLKKINLPDSLTEIADDALPSPGIITVTATEGTDAYNWAVDKGYIVPEGSVVINETNFPDENFRDYVSDNFDTDENGTLSASEIAAVKSIDVSGSNVSDLTGIEHFSALRSLDTGDCWITNLDLSANAALEQLNSCQSWSLNISGCPNLLTAIKSGVRTDNSYRSRVTYAYNGELGNFRLTCGSDFYNVICLGTDPAEFEVFLVEENVGQGFPDGIVKEAVAGVVRWASSDPEVATVEGESVYGHEKDGPAVLSGYGADDTLQVVLHVFNPYPVATDGEAYYESFRRGLPTAPITLLQDTGYHFRNGQRLMIADFNGHSFTAECASDDCDLTITEENGVTVYACTRVPGNAVSLLRDGVEIAHSNYVSELFPLAKHGDVISLNAEARFEGYRLSPNMSPYGTITLLFNGHGFYRGVTPTIFLGDSCTVLTDEAPDSGFYAVDTDDQGYGKPEVVIDTVGDLYRLRTENAAAIKEFDRTITVNTTDDFSDDPELQALAQNIIGWDTDAHESAETELFVGGLNTSFYNGTITALDQPGKESMGGYNSDHVIIAIIHYTVVEPPAGSVEISAANFPDENFHDYISENFDTDENGTLSAAELAAVEEINCAGMDIADLSGIKFFTALKKLNCGGNPSAGGGALTALDVSGMTALETLEAGANPLQTLNVQGCTALKELYCYFGALSTLDVTGCPALSVLDCRGMNLTALDLTHNRELTSMKCDHNQITSLNLSQNGKLKVLTTGGCPITALDLSQNGALEELDCGGNQLMALDVSHNPALTKLTCAGNQLGTLNLSQNGALRELYCGQNLLTALDVSGHKALVSLGCFQEGALALNITGCPTLVEAYENGLTLADPGPWIPEGATVYTDGTNSVLTIGPNTTVTSNAA